MRFEWRRRPFFHAALLFSTVIFFWQYFHLPVLIPQDPISYEIGNDSRPLFLGGQVDSEVETRPMPFGGVSSAFILRTERLWEEPGSPGRAVRGRVRVSWKNPPEALRYGNTLVIEGELARFKDARNPGGFDARAYWERQKVSGAFYAGKKARFKLLSLAEGNPLKAGVIRAKQALSRRLTRDFEGWQAAFLQALFLGERRELDQDFRDLFLKTGTMHILAVSGFNIGFLTTVVWVFLMPFVLPRNWKLALMLASVWAYCLLVGWQAPVVRASIMASIVLIGSFSGRKADALNSLGLAACVILALNPLQLFDVGFQLSFLAVFGLVVFSPAFIRRPELLPHERRTAREKAFFAVEELFWVSFICVLVTLPVTVQNFFIVTPYALLANLIVVPVSFLLFFIGSVYFLTAGWVPPVLFFVPALLKTLMQLMVQCLFFIENLPGAAFIVGRLHGALALALACGIFYLLWDPKFVSRRARAAALILFCANVFMLQAVVRHAERKFEMTMLDVGQGDSVYFEFPEGGNLLIDTGGARFSDKGRWVVSPFLKSKGVRSLDAVLVSHPQEDHVGGLLSVLHDLRVKNVIESGRPYEAHFWKETQNAIAAEKAIVWTAGRGDRVEGFRGADLEILHPEKGAPPEKNINNDSLVLKVRYGAASFLMTGDIQKPAMRKLLDSGQDLKADVLKVPHHGSKLDAEGVSFIEAVGPKLSLISCGERNPFGHPAPETLAALEAVPGNRVLRTDEAGAIAQAA